jgi:hypothetical protein
MRAMPPGYQRKGKALHIKFDGDAVALLYAIAPTKKAIGRYLSELIRRDYVRRHEWQPGRAAQMTARGEGEPRPGKCLIFQFDFDAVALLDELCEARQSFGRYLSELVRQDFVRRQEWEQVRAGTQPELVNVGALGA